jgi:hypothetical protein
MTASAPRNQLNGPSSPDHAEFTRIRELWKLDNTQSMRAKAPSIAFAGDQCCLWRQGSTMSAGFIPDDPFDDAEYVRWLMAK